MGDLSLKPQVVSRNRERFSRSRRFQDRQLGLVSHRPKSESEPTDRRHLARHTIRPGVDKVEQRRQVTQVALCTSHSATATSSLRLVKYQLRCPPSASADGLRLSTAWPSTISRSWRFGRRLPSQEQHAVLRAQPKARWPGDGEHYKSAGKLGRHRHGLSSRCWHRRSSGKTTA